MTVGDNFLNQLMDEEDITWQSMIFELVNTQQMDPWDVDLSILSENFLKMIGEMKETNLKIGGKVILAATILLRLKSGKFIDTDLAQLEKLISGINEDYDDDFEEYGDFESDGHQEISKDPKKYKIYPRTPQPRKRRVSVYDLVTALEKVIDRNKIKVANRKQFITPTQISIKNIDMNILIKDVFETLNTKCRTKPDKMLKFSEITPSNRREDLIATFLPLLHLTNQRVTDLYQDEAFSDFDVHLIKEGLDIDSIHKLTEE